MKSMYRPNEGPRMPKMTSIPNQSRIIINNRDSGIIQTNRMRILSSHSGVSIQPAQNLLMPDEAVLGILNPNHNNNTALARRALIATHDVRQPPPMWVR